MTNEELAIKIQLGQTEYYAELWEQCRRLLFKILSREIKNISLPNSLSMEDLRQEMFFSLRRAVRAYDKSGPYTFTSYLNFSVKNTLKRVLSLINNKEISLNQTISDKDGSETELIDLLSDERSLTRLEDVELSDVYCIVREAVADLPLEERRIIERFYFNGLSHARIAALYSIDRETVDKLKSKALQHLRKDRRLKGLYRELFMHGYSINYYYR